MTLSEFNQNVFFLLLTLLSQSAMSQSPDFEVLNGFKVIEDSLRSNGITSLLESSEQIDYNLAFVFSLPNGKILVSQNDGLIGVLFNNQKAFQSVLMSRKFPVSDPASPFFLERDIVVSLPKSVDHYVAILDEMGLGIIPEKRYTDEMLRMLSRKINLDPKIKKNERVMIALGIYLGEAIRKQIGGQWKMDQKPTLNPFYIPYIALGKRNVVYWRSFFDHLKRKTVSLDKVKAEIVEYYLDY